jgi:hypothetical protein
MYCTTASGLRGNLAINVGEIKYTKEFQFFEKQRKDILTLFPY